MAYTNPWSDTDPPGSQNANTVDDEFRQLRLDIHERMDALVEDWTDDPVVPLGGGAGGGAILTSKKCLYLDSSPPGSKASTLVNIQAHMRVAFTGTTNAVGVITFNVNEISVLTGIVWNIATHGLDINLLSGRRSSDNVPAFMTVIGSSGITNTFTLEFRYGDGAIYNNIQINGTLLITAQVNPT